MSEKIHDSKLLRSFVHDGSQSAFATLTRRYSGLAFHVGKRFTGSAELAEEAAQNAFGILAKKAAAIDASDGLAPWLHRTVFFEASKLRDKERRYRAQVSQYAQENATACVDDLQEIGSALDLALNELEEGDRTVILQRFFYGYSYDELAELDGSASATWRKRCSRAIDRLREKLHKRGAVVPVAILTGGLSVVLQQPAPASVTASLLEVSSASGATAQVTLWTPIKLLSIATVLVLLTTVTVNILKSQRSQEHAVESVDAKPRLSALTKKSRETKPAALGTPIQFTAEEKRAWLQSFRDHLNQPGPPHSGAIMPQIGGLGGGRPFRSPLHLYLKRVGGDASELIEILKEALDSDRATVAYRSLGYWGWVRQYAGVDGANTLIDFAGRTEVRNNALYAFNILGQYADHFPDDMAKQFEKMLKSGSDNAKIALSYYGSGFVANEQLGKNFRGQLLPLLDHNDPSTRFAAARILAEMPEERSSKVLKSLLEIPDYLEDYHFDRTLSQLLEMPTESASRLKKPLAEDLGKFQERLPTEPGVYLALLKFDLAGDQAPTIVRWQQEAQALTKRRGDESLTMDELMTAMQNPLARPHAIKEIRRIGPNAIDYRDELIAMLKDDPKNRDLAFAAYSTDINRPHPYPWVDMRGMYEVLRPVDEALAASDDPTWIKFRQDLDVWMIGEPHTDASAAKKLADDLGDVSPELRALFISGMREGKGFERLVELAFGSE